MFSAFQRVTLLHSYLAFPWLSCAIICYYRLARMDICHECTRLTPDISKADKCYSVVRYLKYELNEVLSCYRQLVIASHTRTKEIAYRRFMFHNIQLLKYFRKLKIILSEISKLTNIILVRLRFSRRWLWRMVSSGMLRRVALVKTDVSEEPGASFIRVTRIGELGTTQAATSNRRTLGRNTKWERKV
jgi:hypothetical protein